MDPAELQSALAALKANIDAAVARMPSHQEFLAQYCPAGDA
jgi:tryptophan halogenase